MKTKVIEIPITVYGDDASADYNEDETIVISDLTLVHIQTPRRNDEQSTCNILP